MHLIHKLRRSISHRPRHLLDLPDEILCLILEYCCQDLDFLLWSCPLVTLENQFCHDCFHCTLCHGPIPRPRPQRRGLSHSQRNHLVTSISTGSTATSTTTVAATATTTTAAGSVNKDNVTKYPSSKSGSSSSSSNRSNINIDPSGGTILKKRRKRCHERTSCSTIDNSGRNRYMTCQQHNSQGSKPCPRNGNRPWCRHLQQQQSARIPFLWRFFPQLMVRAGYASNLPLQSMLSDMRISSLSRPFDHLTQITSSISSVQPSAKSALNGVVHRLERAFSFLSSREDTDDSGQLQINSHNSSATVQLGATSSTVFRNSGVSSGRFNPAQDGTLLRRRTLSLSAHTSNPSSASISRPWALTRTIQAANFWRRDEKLGPLDSSFDDSENDESGDDFDSSIHLALPFQLLLVSQRFADATVQSLWRNLVFHGHDAYQMQSLLSTLSMDDGISYDPLGHESGRRMSNLARLKVHEEEVVEDDDKVQENDDKVQENDDKVLVTSKNHHAVEIMKTGPAAEVSSDFNTYPPKYGSSEHQPPIWQANETNMSWIDSLKNPSKFQGAGVYGSNTEALATAATSAAASTTTAIAESSKPPALKASHAKGQRRHTSASSNLMYRNGYQSMGSARNDRSRVDRNGLPGTKPNEPRWSYRRHVRRAVLNFSHPQASPQMFLKVLECLRTRCPDQIVALDLHANEKMRDAGLDKPEELERYFGSGFSKLRYLRLQGGFVDNQLLCALIKGLGSSELASSDDNSRLSSIGSPRTSPMNSTYFASSCKLSQVFLGPGSITDTAVEKLIAAAGHCLEVFTVTSCVDVGGGALADLLTSCPKLRVLGVHRSLARDKDLLEGLGIEVDGVTTGMPQAQMNEQPVPEYSGISSNGNGNYQNMPPARVRKTIVAPLERLELGTVKLTGVGVTEILKGTCESLRFLVLETQHFSEELLTDVITPFCSKLEGLYFDDPEYIQKQQQQMQGLGFSAGRRGTHLPNRQFEFGRSKRTFYSDPSRHHQRVSLQPNSQHQQHNQFPGSEAVERQNTTRSKSFSKVSAWLGETTTEEWIACGDCALWISSASPGVSYENGGPDTGSQRRNSQHPRWQPTPLYNAYHSDTFMRSLGGSASGTGRYSSNSNGEYDDILAKFQVRRATVENVIQTLKPNLTAFTVMQSDFIEESQGVSELKMLMQQDERWVQSTAFLALRIFFVCLFLSSIYFGTLRW